MVIRVGFNASGLAAPKHQTGVERYMGSLLRALAARADSDGMHLTLYFGDPPRREMPTLAGLTPSDVIRWRVAPTLRGWLRVGMGAAMVLDRIQVFHFPAPLMAGFCPVPAVVTFHDLAALSLSPDQTAKERRYLADALDAGRRAKALIAVSETAAAEVRQHLGRHDVITIPEGVDLTQFVPAPPEAVAALRARLGVGEYFLCVGTLQTRKNHLGLIRAFEQIAGQVPHDLVIAGGDGSGAAAIRAYLAERPNPRVRLVGYLPDPDLPALYTGATALALPSFWEGFGLPLLEAMACGTPVLTSNVSSLAEVAGGAAVLVDPADEGALGRGLLALATDSALRGRLIQAGRERAESYSWAEAARRTAAVYRQVAGG